MFGELSRTGPRIEGKKSSCITSREGTANANEEREKPGRTEGKGKERGSGASRPDGRNSSCNSRSRIAPGPVVGPSGRVTPGEIIIVRIGHLVLIRRPSDEFGRVARVPSLPPSCFVSRRRGPVLIPSRRENFRRRLIEKTRNSEN